MANQGDISRIELDLTRYEGEELDISGKFNARAGDMEDFLPMMIKSNGYPQDVRNWGLIYGGTDANMVPHRHIIGRIGDLPSRRGDNPVAGRFTLPFDSRTFNISGKWNQFFVQFINEDGQTVSTVDLSFNVLENSFAVSIGAAEDIYVEEFEAIKTRLKEKGDVVDGELQDWLVKYKQTLLDALAEINDPKNGLYVRYRQLLDMTTQIQNTLKNAQFHDRIFQYATIDDMKAAVMPLPGDFAATQGWSDRDDGRGGFWRIRVKRSGEVANDSTTIATSTGFIAERDYGIVQDMEPIKMGRIWFLPKADSTGFVDYLPSVHMYVSKYGAGIAQLDVDEAGGSSVSEIPVQAIFDGLTCDLYISPADIRFRMPDMNLETPSQVECDGPNAYIVSNIYTLTVSLKGAETSAFMVYPSFITNYRDLTVTLH